MGKKKEMILWGKFPPTKEFSLLKGLKIFFFYFHLYGYMGKYKYTNSHSQDTIIKDVLFPNLFPQTGYTVF